MVYILLATGFEEIEALTPCDLLRRAGVEVQFVGVNGLSVTGGHTITIQADVCIEDIKAEDVQMLVLPGGLGGVQSLRESEKAMELIRAVSEQGNYVAAICAAPTILAELGLTDGHLATCYPTMREQMGSAVLMPEAEAVQDGRIITGTSAGTAIAFSLQLITALCGREKAEQVADEIVYRT